VLAFLVRRLFFAAGTVILTAFFAYGTMRFLRPEQYPGQATVADLLSDVERALLHFDFGGACMFPGCPSIKGLWLDGIWADLLLLAGGVAFAVAFGVLGGLWCASRPRSRSARALEALATVLYCAPVYVVGAGMLLLFAPPFGLIQLPYFFDPDSYAPPLEDPWDFVRSMILPWVVVGAPLGAAILRLTMALAIDTLGEDYVRTAAAKGVPHAKIVRRHAGPPTYASVASLLAASAPLMVTNLVLVEYVLAIPGFFRHMRRELGQVPNWPPPKIPPLGP
jgi:peptide/nickel transport system permease protein